MSPGLCLLGALNEYSHMLNDGFRGSLSRYGFAVQRCVSGRLAQFAGPIGEGHITVRADNVGKSATSDSEIAGRVTEMLVRELDRHIQEMACDLAAHGLPLRIYIIDNPYARVLEDGINSLQPIWRYSAYYPRSAT